MSRNIGHLRTGDKVTNDRRMALCEQFPSSGRQERRNIVGRRRKKDRADKFRGCAADERYDERAGDVW